MILVSFSITVSEGFDSTLAGAKKKKKKPVSFLKCYEVTFPTPSIF